LGKKYLIDSRKEDRFADGEVRSTGAEGLKEKEESGEVE